MDRGRTRAWPRQHHYQVQVPQGHVSLRLLCPGPSIGGVIGNNGAVVSQLRRDSGARIHCQNASSDEEDGVVFVHGPAARDRTLVVDGVSCDVTCSQDGAVRVLERMWEIDDNGGGDCVCGRLVVSESQVRVLSENGGDILARLRKETCAHIRILQLPSYFPSGDELVQISGTISGVKKALVAVTSYLIDQPQPLENKTTHLNRRQTESLSEIFPNLVSLLPPITCDALNKISNEKGTWQEVAFRLLCSNEAAGTVIGRQGTIVKSLENETRATIVFSAPKDGFGNRIVTISAFENLESQHSPAQNAVILVFARSVEGEIEKGSIQKSTQNSTVTAKLLVSSDLLCCLTEKLISETRQVSGTNIHILGVDPENKLAQITGEYRAVQDVLFRLTSILRDYLLYHKVVNEARPIDSPSVAHRSLGLTCQMNQLGISEHTVELGNANNVRTNGRVGMDIEAKSGNKLAVVRNTILEIVLSEHAFGSIYGEDNGNMNRLREISGAKVEVHDPRPGENEGKVVISGTPDQTRAAQSLLQAFIQST